MRLRIRPSILAGLLIPLLATCGGETGPSGPTAKKLALVQAPPATVANGVTLTPTPTVALQSSSGEAVAKEGVSVTVAVSAGRTLSGTTTVVTDADGEAAFADLQVSGPAGTVTLTFSSTGLTSATTGNISLTAGVPALIERLSADSQAGVVTLATVATTPVVRVKDAAGNAIAGLTVVPSITGGGGTLTPPGGGYVTSNVGSVSITGWQVGAPPGINTLSVSVAGHPGLAPVVFKALGLIGTVSTVELAQPPSPLIVDTTLVNTVVATVKDGRGNPIPGVTVTFTPSTGNSSFSGNSPTTDVAGHATLGGWRIGTTVGTYGIRATANAIESSPRLVQGIAATAVLVSGPGTIFRRINVPEPLVVHVTDRFGNAKAGATVNFALGSGTGTILPAQGITDSAGNAQSSLTPTGGGVLSVVAALAALPDSDAAITVQVVAPSALELVAGDAQSGRAGVLLDSLLVVRVVDSAATGIQGAPVVLVGLTGPGTSATTDSTGVGKVQWRPGGAIGGQTIGVVSDWVPGDTAWFSATIAPGPATTVQLIRAASPTQVATLVDTLPILELKDQFGNLAQGQRVLFGASDTVVADALGRASPTTWQMGVTAGPQQLLARFPGSPLLDLTLQALAVHGPLSDIVQLNGTAGHGFAGEKPTIVPTFRAVDGFGNPIPGASVSVAVIGGGGAIGSVPAVFDTAGRLRITTWTLGTGANQLRLTSGNDTTIATATGFAPGGFHIQLVGVPAQFEDEFAEAAFKWRRAITGDIPDVMLDVAAQDCGQSFSGAGDDLVIGVQIGPIDGPGQILGQAGPCIVRTGSLLPAFGIMRFDIADAAELQADGVFDDVVMHEMGHVLGVGSLWAPLGLSVTNIPDAYFTGAGALTQFNAIGGAGYGGNKTPIETTGGAGTRFVHWRESVMPSELMTGFLSAAFNPMSTISIASLADLGYSVDLGVADAYNVFGAPPAVPAAPGVRIEDEVFAPRYSVDPAGKLHPVAPR